MNEIASLWQVHRDAGWPKFSNTHEGELMTLDTVVSGCIMFYLGSERDLDPRRVAILESCLADLTTLLSELSDEAGDYFERLRRLAALLLGATRRR